jgi:glycosyltransferase involved in cell wall biosynthesis
MKILFDKGLDDLTKNGSVYLITNPTILALIPAYNEEGAIARVILQTQNFVDKVVVCDDGSRDLTPKIASALGAIVVRHRRNLGKGAAFRTLFAKAEKIGADIAITLDGDGQHDPKEIPRLIEAMRASGADIVVGSRFMNEGDEKSHVPPYRALGNRILSMLTDRRVSDTQSGFRAYGKAAVHCLRLRETGMGVDSEILMRAEANGLKMVEVPINVNYNVIKPSKQNFLLQSAQIVFGIARYNSNRRPLLFYGLPGLIACMMALGIWIQAFQLIMKTGQVTISFVFTAAMLTTVGLFLLSVSLTLRIISNRARKP